MTKESLTDEQIADLLAGRPSAQTLTLLHENEQSQVELAGLKSALHMYRAETLDWAERRSAAAPSLEAAARRQARWFAVPQWSLAAIAVATVAVGVGHMFGHVPDAAGNTATVLTADVTDAPTSSADIVSDDELLTSIDAALSSARVSPVEALGLEPVQTEGALRRNVE